MNRLHAAALAFVNDVRRETGRRPLKKLPKGTPRSRRHCPLARSIPGNTEVIPGRGLFIDDRCFSIPTKVESFLLFFDNWCYPELIERG